MSLTRRTHEIQQSQYILTKGCRMGNMGKRRVWRIQPSAEEVKKMVCLYFSMRAVLLMTVPATLSDGTAEKEQRPWILAYVLSQWTSFSNHFHNLQTWSRRTFFYRWQWFTCSALWMKLGSGRGKIKGRTKYWWCVWGRIVIQRRVHSRWRNGTRG